MIFTMTDKRLIYHFFILMLPMAGCINNNKPESANTLPISIYKQWQFKKMDTSSIANHSRKPWVGNNILDLRSKDTLQFSYGGMHNKPTSYSYKIQHDTIFIQNKPGYKIVKLTDSELYIMAIFNHLKMAGRDSDVMIYGIK